MDLILRKVLFNEFRLRQIHLSKNASLGDESVKSFDRMRPVVANGVLDLSYFLCL